MAILINKLMPRQRIMLGWPRNFMCDLSISLCLGRIYGDRPLAEDTCETLSRVCATVLKKKEIDLVQAMYLDGLSAEEICDSNGYSSSKMAYMREDIFKKMQPYSLRIFLGDKEYNKLVRDVEASSGISFRKAREMHGASLLSLGLSDAALTALRKMGITTVDPLMEWPVGTIIEMLDEGQPEVVNEILLAAGELRKVPDKESEFSFVIRDLHVGWPYNLYKEVIGALPDTFTPPPDLEETISCILTEGEHRMIRAIYQYQMPMRDIAINNGGKPYHQACYSIKKGAMRKLQVSKKIFSYGRAAAIDKFLSNPETKKSGLLELIDSLSIHNLPLSEALIRMLNHEGIFTIDQLVKLTREDILSIPGIRNKKLGTIEKALSLYDLRLAG